MCGKGVENITLWVTDEKFGGGGAFFALTLCYVLVPSIKTAATCRRLRWMRKLAISGNLAFLLVDKTREFVEACYERGDLDAALSCLDPVRATCYGYASGCHAFDTDAVARLLGASCAFARRIGSRIVSHECHLAYRNETCAVVLSSLRTRATKGDAEGEPSDDEYERRLTFVYAPVGDDWLIVHMHSSAPHAPDDPFASRRMTARDVGAVDLDAVLSQAKVERERYEIVSELSDDVIYEYDVGRDTLYLFLHPFRQKPRHQAQQAGYRALPGHDRPRRLRAPRRPRALCGRRAQAVAGPARARRRARRLRARVPPAAHVLLRPRKRAGRLQCTSASWAAASTMPGAGS